MISVHAILQMDWKDQAEHLKGLNLEEVTELKRNYQEFEVNYSRLGLAIVSVIRDLREAKSKGIQKAKESDCGKLH